ncbi:biliverdin-producing heme oxygenase [Microvirga sp. STS02]|uniref:biliverdin-producing heme oxygenase n=1 Tax=Hymenobacter negativus TaxID=2795026 RepID=UPI0018DC2954|nr:MULTISPECIES: biliverdin-producing heme oxygenase [Bacteria]MBH8569533.1 biliverdin-producing heme oxygenase [Hymenobacter negativus]MBR7209269.1 biliverdin-producing heme oxygenase [Microvirga sp. STS02]
MSHPQESPAILPRLRHETRPFHDAVEQNPFNLTLGAGTVTAADTAQFLARMYGFLQPYEAQLHAHAAAFGPAWQLDQRYRAPLILEDLARLGHPVPPPRCPALPPLSTRAQLLGAMYVFEGSTLGGQVIARQLDKAGIAAHAFFTGRAGRTGPLWKAFGEQLTEAAEAGHDDPAAIVASAVHTFQALAKWLNQP